MVMHEDLTKVSLDGTYIFYFFLRLKLVSLPVNALAALVRRMLITGT